MHAENLVGSKRLFFIALWVDIAVTAAIAVSALWAIGALKEIQSGAVTYSQSLGDRLQFWENFAKLAFLTWIVVGLTLVKWLKSCYRYAKEADFATGFKYEGWTVGAWIIPFANIFIPFQIISEIYKAGAPGYHEKDGWKQESGSGILLTWWIFWLLAHLIMTVAGKQAMQNSSLGELTMPQVIGIYDIQAWVCAISILVAVLWFFVANHLTGRLLGRKPLVNSGLVRMTTEHGKLHIGGVDTAVQSGEPKPIAAAPGKVASHQLTQPVVAASVTDANKQVQAQQTVPYANSELSNEEDHWATAMAELELGQRRPGLWAKAFAESEGDETKAKVAYLKSRVQQLTETAHRLIAEMDRQRRDAARNESEAALAGQKALELLQAEFITKSELTADQLKVLVRDSDDESRKFLLNRFTGNTLLHACAACDLLEEVQLLLTAGADPQRSNNSGKRPEFMTENWVTRLLLSNKGLSVESLRRAQQLGIAYGLGTFSCNNQLFSRLPDAIDFATAASTMPNADLLHAVHAGDWRQVKTLLESGVSLVGSDPSGKTLLDHANLVGDELMISVLQMHGAK